ncbi:hypothetical protein IWZ00DRAFT_534485 [Phyllosticta capitalensis]
MVSFCLLSCVRLRAVDEGEQAMEETMMLSSSISPVNEQAVKRESFIFAKQQEFQTVTTLPPSASSSSRTSSTPSPPSLPALQLRQPLHHFAAALQSSSSISSSFILLDALLLLLAARLRSVAKSDAHIFSSEATSPLRKPPVIHFSSLFSTPHTRLKGLKLHVDTISHPFALQHIQTTHRSSRLPYPPRSLTTNKQLAMCIRYVPIYQCNHREHRPQPELYLCSRALCAFAYQAKTAPIISTTNGTFVCQKLASRTAGCLTKSSSELQLFYQIAPGWCDGCLANGRATSCQELMDRDMLPFKTADVGCCFAWVDGVAVARRWYTEAQERVRAGEGEQWEVQAVAHPLHNRDEGVECSEWLDHRKRSQVANKKRWNMGTGEVMARDIVARRDPNSPREGQGAKK